MIEKYLFKSIVVIIGLFSQINLYAQDIPSISLDVETAGTLNSLIAESKRGRIMNLTLTGSINGSDIKIIQELENLEYLDLANVNIVSGGAYYYKYSGARPTQLYTENNIISGFMFRNLSNLKTIILPESVEKISNAFHGGEGSISSGDGSFSYSLGASPFAGCSSLVTIKIGKSLKAIQNTPFTSIKFKEFIVSEENNNFSTIEGVLLNKEKTDLIFYPYSREAESYTIPETVTTILESAFRNCSSLVEVIISDNVKEIKRYAFHSCENLTNISIGENVTNIGYASFYNCMKLTNVSMGNNIREIGSRAFWNCQNLVSISIPLGITSIEEYTFAKCAKLTNIVIPERVIDIKNNAFYNCIELMIVLLENNIASIGRAFTGCVNIKEIYCKKTTPPAISSFCFLDADKSVCKLYIPKGSYNTYWVASGWGDFQNIIEMDFSSINAINRNDISIQSISKGIAIETKGRTSVSVYNLSGQKIYQSVMLGNTEIRLNKGVYIVRIDNESQKVIVK